MLLNSYSVWLSDKIQITFTIAKVAALCIVIIGGIVRLAQGMLFLVLCSVVKNSLCMVHVNLNRIKTKILNSNLLRGTFGKII